MNCWELKKCGRDKTKDCPAYPNHGQTCWKVAGTMCDGKVQGSFAKKLANCMYCDFYKTVKGLGAEDFSEGWFLKGILVDLAELTDGLIIPYTSTSRIGTKFADQIYYRLKNKGKTNITSSEYGDIIIDIMNNKLGGSFNISSCDSKSITLMASKCFLADRPSYTLCKLSSGIFGNLSLRYFGYGKVVLEKTIAEGSKSCEIKVYFKRTKESDEKIGLEFTKDLELLQLSGKALSKEESERQSVLRKQIIGMCGNMVTLVNKDNVDIILRSFRGDLANLANIDMGALYLIEPAEGVFELKTYFGLDEEIIEKVRAIKIIDKQNDESEKQYNNRQLKVISSFDSQRADIEQAKTLHSFATIPLISHGKLIGALNIASSRQEPIGVEESNLIRDICNLLIVILENHELHNRITTSFGQIVSDLDWIKAKLSKYEASGEDQRMLLIRLLLDKAGIRDQDLRKLHINKPEVA